MNRSPYTLLMIGIISLVLMLAGCKNDSDSTAPTSVGAVGTGNGTETGVVNDDGIDVGIAATATTVAGKVTLSSIVSAKARAKAAQQKALRLGKPGSDAYNRVMSKASQVQKAIDERGITTYDADVSFSQGKVFLYNSSRPAWIHPVAEATTDATGVYTLEALINADKNLKADGTVAYVDGESIPGGNYTLLAFTEKDYGLFQLPDLVALQSVVSEFAGAVPGIDLEASQSTANPTVTKMLGVSKNTDGTQTWGDTTLELAPNAALQVSFSMPMYRTAVTTNFLSIESSDGGAVPDGLWTLSADWLTATYYPNEGSTWDPGKTYTVTVKGSDSDGGVAIYNIFGRFLELSGVGTFKVVELAAGEVLADLIDGKKPNVTISSPKFGALNDVTVITPIRIVADERMDVNGLRVKATPSLGAQPGVLFVGKTADNLYEYEFVLGEPLKLGSDYTVTVAGGSDLAGNVMDDYKVSFSTEATSEGIPAIDTSLTGDDLVEAEKKVSDQTDVKDVFGKWVRAFNDRNLPQLQSVMTSEFVMGYNATSSYNVADLNRDAKFDINEFAVRTQADFLKWDHCGVEMTGSIVGDINVDIVAQEADFAFTLSSVATEKSPECQQAAVDVALFANLEKMNGGWYINKASDGVDNRDVVEKVVVTLDLTAPEDASTGAFYDEATQTETDVSFKWTAVEDATAYIWMVFDSRNPASGFGLIVPAGTTELNIPSDIDTLMEAGTIADVGEDFGFTDAFEPRDGSQLFWQVAALGSNTVSLVSNDRATDLPSDVIAKSDLWSVKIPGEYETLDFRVSPNTSDLGVFRDNKDAADPAERFSGSDEAPVKFSEFIGGFDVGDASFATISFNTSDDEITHGFVQVEGNTRIERLVEFIEGVATVTVPLNSGTNNVMVSNGVPCWKTNTCSEDQKDDNDGVEEWFQIVTTGGVQPIIFFGDNVDVSGVTTVNSDGVETVVENNNWNWFESADGVSVKLTGKININSPVFEAGLPEDVRLDVGSESGGRATMKVDVNSEGVFSGEVKIFKGDNWVNVSTSVCNVDLADDQECQHWQRREFQDHFGIRTEVGSEYTPPIYDIVVTNAETSEVITQKENWGDGGRWNASEVTENQIVVSGFLDVTSGEPKYSAGSEGGWVEGKLSVGPDGGFSFTVDLYSGENWIDIQDASGTTPKDNNRYNLNVVTALGQVVVRPEITSIVGEDGVEIAFTGEDITTNQCSITLNGTSMEGNMEASWNGEKEVDKAGEGEDSVKMMEWYGQRFMLETEDVDGVHTFSVTLPLVGDPTSGDQPPAVRAENWIEIFDANWNRLGMRVISTGDCGYEVPKLTVTAVKDSEGNTLDKMYGGDNQGSYGPAGSGNTVAQKAFEGSVGLDVSTPADGTMEAGLGTMITGSVDLSVFPMTGSEVVRIVIEDPNSDGPPSQIFTSSSRDAMVQKGAEVFDVNSGGDFSVQVDLDSAKGWIIMVLVWDDMTAMEVDEFGEDDGPIDPDAGHVIAVNGAVWRDEEQHCDSSTETCPDNNKQQQCDSNTETCPDNNTQQQCDSSTETCPDNTAQQHCDSSTETCPDDSTQQQCDSSTETCPDNTTQQQCDSNTETCPDDGAQQTAGNETLHDDKSGDVGGNQSVTTDTISIEGETNVKGGDITVELEGCGGPERYMVTAETTANVDGWYNWSTDTANPVVVYDGHNRMRVRNGPMEYHIDLNATSNSELPDPVLVVGVSANGTALTEVVDANKGVECGRSMWDADDASTVTVSGSTAAPDGEGEWRADGQFGRFQIVDGAFSIEDVILFNGENRFELNDTQWNRHELYIETAGGSTRPQYITVEGLGDLAVGPQTVTGTVHGQATTGDQARFNIHNMNVDLKFGDVRYEFVTDPNELQWRQNAKVLELTPVAESATGDYTFTLNIFVPSDPGDDTSESAAQGYLDVWAGGEKDDGGWTDHGLSTPINDTTSDTNYWKAKR